MIADGPRVCPDCGEPEKREADRVNLDPVTGRCIPCLVAFTSGTPREMPKVADDWARRAANDRESE